MTLSLLVDECIQAKMLVEQLRTEGHKVFTATEAGLQGLTDKKVLEFASANNLLVLTINCDDFVEETRPKRNHPGVLLVYQNEDSIKNMSYQQIVQAIRNLEASQVSLPNGCHTLNQYNY
ncbi:DUF5615 family PIN-like protein [bacterium]|nr:DUF5615 family PIN-like protein [bacterium]MBP9809359.1 DUF5615 family PIN-like protein [bacterium]